MLKVNQFLHGLKAKIYRDIKMSTYIDTPYIKVVEENNEAKKSRVNGYESIVNSQNINLAKRYVTFGKENNKITIGKKVFIWKGTKT